MSISGRFEKMVIVGCLLGASAAIALVAQENGPAQEAKLGIERLHQQDVEGPVRVYFARHEPVVCR